MDRVLIALTSAVVIVGASGCGPSSNPRSTTSTPPAGTPSACSELGGTLGPDQLCKVHDSATNYSLDISFPVDYPDQRSVTDYLKRQRDDFVAFAQKSQPTGRPTPYSLDIEGTAYRSGPPNSGTQSLVFEVENDEGVAHQGHPDTSYDVFNYDLGQHAPITLDALFKPGPNPVDVLTPIVEPELAKHSGEELIPALHDAGAQAYENFAITDDAVIFFFGESRLQVSDSGPCQVSVARNRLDSMLAIPPVDQARVHAR